MKMHLAFTMMLLALLAGGCQSSGKPILPGPANPEQIQRIRVSMQAQDPAVQVGMVVDVLESEMLAAVNDVDLSTFKVGQTVCFIDSSSAPLVCGRVVRITSDQVHVKYEAPGTDRRAPMKGDVAVAFK